MNMCDYCGKRVLAEPVMVDDRIFCSIPCAEQDAAEEFEAEEASHGR